MSNKKDLERNLTIITSYLTKEEAEEMLPLYTKYYNPNFGDMFLKDVDNPYLILSQSFYWESTNEKHEFWNKLAKKLNERYKSLNVKKLNQST
jgi:hypothetical protein